MLPLGRPTLAPKLTEQTMSLVLTGTTTADYGNPSKLQTLTGATLVFYAADPKQASRTPRWGFYPHSGAIEGRELGRATVKPDGSFATVLSANPGAVLVAIEVERFSYAPATGKRAQGVLGVAMLAATDVARDAANFELERLDAAQLRVALPKPAYCALLHALDLWLAAGRVLTGSPAIGVSGLQVTAFDRDITQDDELGTATTDATGSFEVFFPGAAFRRLPLLSGLFASLTSLELVGGPDLFFRVRAGTYTLLDEAASMGRVAGRENSHNCAYNELTVVISKPGPGPSSESGPTVWQAIGSYSVVPATPGGPTSFDADGFTTVGKLAFYGNIQLRGAAFRKHTNGEPIRYRFLVREWGDPRATTGGPVQPALPAPHNVDPDPAVPSGWMALSAGISGEYGHIIGFVIGADGMAQVTSIPLLASPNTNGWIEVDQRALGSNEYYTPAPSLCSFDTRVLVPAGGFVPRKLSLVFQVQATSVAYQQPLQPLHVCNDQVFLDFQLSGIGSGCNPFTRTPAGTVDINAAFTVKHPYLESYSTYVMRHDGANRLPLSASDAFVPSTPIWLDPPSLTGTATRSGYAVEPCSYEAGIHAQARLTNGESKILPAGPAKQSFCVR